MRIFRNLIDYPTIQIFVMWGNQYGIEILA